MSETTPYVLSIQVGLPQTYGSEGAADPMDRPWSTGFFKTPIEGTVWVGETHLAGDGQADLENHGGREKAILAYAADHYSWWRSHLNLPDLPYGGFGENLTVAEQDENSVCVGDTYALGEVRLQVSQPRQPCWKLSRRWRIQDLAVQVQKNGRSGWYFRVLQPGYIEAGQPLVLQERPHPEWTIALANRVMHHQRSDRAAAAALAACPLLSDSWRDPLLRRAGSADTSS